MLQKNWRQKAVFKKLINSKLVTHLKKSGFLTDFQNILGVSSPTDDLFRVIIDKIAWVFNISGAVRTVGLDISAEAYIEPCSTSMTEHFYEDC